MNIDLIGQDKSWVLEATKVPEVMREDEPMLAKSRWFDYRRKTPAQLTYLFTDRYVALYREMYAKTRDFESAGGITVLFSDDVFDGPNLLSFWQARQIADRIGCEYDFYLRFAFERTWERGWRYIPRPNQLYGDELAADAKDAWTHNTLFNLRLAKDAFYRPESYVGHPDQDAYHAYLIQQIKRREQPVFLLARLLYKEKCLPESVAGKHFDADTLSRAFNLYR